MIHGREFTPRLIALMLSDEFRPVFRIYIRRGL
jgi:hypothetical protein